MAVAVAGRENELAAIDIGSRFNAIGQRSKNYGGALMVSSESESGK